MERLPRVFEILNSSQYRQPDLVKEAAHRILSRPLRSDPQISYFLQPLIKVLIQYCDNDDSAQRSIFNDYLNNVILAFQYHHYQLLIHVLLEIVTNNGTARTVTAALQRIAYLIKNVQPIDLGCEPQKLLKALIEVARRCDDESVLRALDFLLVRVMPYLDYHLKKSKEMQLLSNSLSEILFKNLQNESSQIKRLAASSISTMCSISEIQLQNALIKLRGQLELLTEPEDSTTNKFVGFCLCVKNIPELGNQYHQPIIKMIIKQIELNSHDSTLVTSALETLRESFTFRADNQTMDYAAKLIAEKFLIDEIDGIKVMKQDIKIILQSNALACIAVILKQRPAILNQLESIFIYRNHADVAVRNQVINIIGNYIEASWRFPFCIEQSVDCERIRKLWVEIRSVLNDDSAHPDTLKTCVVAIKSCINTLLESDHCLHIIEYHDIDRLIQLYQRSNFKPFKIEVLSLFSSVNYRTLYYLERSHWYKMNAHTAGSYLDSLQDRIIRTIVTSLVDEHQRIRNSASNALISLVPNLYIINLGNRSKNMFQRNVDPIVSLAQDLSSEHLVVLEQAEEHIIHLMDCDESSINPELHEKLCTRNEHRMLSSSIIQVYDNPHNELASSQIDATKSDHSVNISTNLMHVIGLLKSAIEDSLEKGKTAISSIVRTLYELSLKFPIHQYSASWDCRPSEYCDCFTLLNFLLTYLENLIEPDVVIEDIDAYKNFLNLSHQLLYALCHESVLTEYEQQRMKPFHKRQANMRDGNWSELTLRHPCIDHLLEVYFTHLTKLLWLASLIIEERNNPYAVSSSKQSSSLQQPETLTTHSTLVSNRSLFNRIFKKLESSFKSSKKNLNQHDEKFFQILETCLSSMSSLLEFVGMNRSVDHVKEILGYLRVTSTSCGVSSLICARQLLKSLFGINILALYQVDPNDWFEEESWPPTTPNLLPQQDGPCVALQGVYHHLVANPYKIFSDYYSLNCSQITPTSDKALSILNFESRRALKVRRRIEERVKSLFEFNPHHLISPRVRQISELLKNTITEFTPIVTDSMNQFTTKGFTKYQSEILHFMSYLILLRVNYQKLAQADDLVTSINTILERCGEKEFASREHGIGVFMRNSFTFLTLLSYERGPSKPMFQVATVIQKLDDLRAKLSMSQASEKDITIYVVPVLRCLVEDLFIYRTNHFQNMSNKTETTFLGDNLTYEFVDQSKKDLFEILEAERETVAQKLLDVIDNPRVYDLLSILILESRQNSSEIKYKKLSKHLLSIIPTILSKRKVNLTNYSCIELTRRIIENISPEVFQPVNFIFETLLEAPKPSTTNDFSSRQEFQRWMSLVIISMHILITQVKEEVFLSRLHEVMSDDVFVEYLLHIAQLCLAEIYIHLYTPVSSCNVPNIVFLTQQLSSYMIYLTHMFQSGLFFQLSRSATDLMKREILNDIRGPKSFHDLCTWARNPANGFSLYACEKMFYFIRLIYPDLTTFWCNVMMLLNNVDCNREYWRNLLVYECHQCQVADSLDQSIGSLSLESSSADESTVELVSEPQDAKKDESKFKRCNHISRPSSLNLSDISFSDQLRRSFIKKIAAAESQDKTFNRNIIETSDEDGQLLEREVTIGNTEQCLSPNIEMTRRAALCLVLDFVTISMNDVEHITWLMIHHINDIIRWSHESPLTEFISAVHGNSASSGIFIQAINSGCKNLTSMSFVTRLLWTLQQVHYTQYGSLVVLLVEKLLSSPDLTPYRSLTKNIEEFACATVQKLLNETNKSLVTTNEEVINQLTSKDLDRIYSMLDVELYPKLTKLLIDLRESTRGQDETPTIELHIVEDDSDDDSENDTELEVLYSKANLIYWLAERNYTGHIWDLLTALKSIRKLLANRVVLDDKDETLVCFLVSAIYSLAMNLLPPPTRLSAPKFWSNNDHELTKNASAVNDKSGSLIKPMMLKDSKRSTTKSIVDKNPLLQAGRAKLSSHDIVEARRTACLKGLFLVENIGYLRITPFEHLPEVIIRLARLPLINSFILTPPILWRQNIWPIKFEENDTYRIKIPMVTHDILSKDYGLLENFCYRLLEIGWTSRRQFEEAWMTLLGVLTTSLSHQDDSKDGSSMEVDKRENLRIACKTVSTITKLLLLTRRNFVGDPLSKDSYPSQTFDERVIELTKAIASNLNTLKRRTLIIFESMEQERKSNSKSADAPPFSKSCIANDNQNTGFSHYLRISAQKLRMNVILNAEIDMQDTVVISSDQENSRNENVDVESCIRLLLSIYKQKFNDPNENLFAPLPSAQDQAPNQRLKNSKHKPNQLAAPLATAICQSILDLSDMFADYEQFDWLFETFIHMFKLAERNEDDIQKQHLIVGLCKSGAVCCYEIPNELTTATAINHRDVMFEKCRQSIDKCIKSEFEPLKLSALFGVYYMLEDSINIVASGAWELDHFKQLRQSRLTWILKLMPIILDKENSRLLSRKAQIMELLKSLCEVVSDSELKAINKA